MATIFALFVCLQSTGQCTPVNVLTNQGLIQRTFATLAECESAAQAKTNELHALRDADHPNGFGAPEIEYRCLQK